MSVHRAVLFVVAALFTAGMTSVASAGCCGWGVQAPVAYPSFGCGGCGAPTAAFVYAQPVAPLPPPAPVVSTWAWGGCCQRSVVYAAVPAVEPMAIAPAPIYVVNQGPDYTGPGIMVPFHTWTPSASYVTPGAYPYRPGYGYGYGYALRRPYFRPRFAYGARFYGHPLYHRPLWRAGWYR